MTLKNVNFKSGDIEYDDFNIDPNVPFKEQISNLKQDLLYVSYKNGLYIIDLGWLPANDPEGNFVLRVIKNSNWDLPVYYKKTRNLSELGLYLQAYVEIITNFVDNKSYQIPFEKTDKRRIYWLINLYLLGEIDADCFTDEYYYCYDLELDSNTLTALEDKEFSELSTIAGRFSNFEEDIQAGFHYSEDELMTKVKEVKQMLPWPE